MQGICQRQGGLQGRTRAQGCEWSRGEGAASRTLPSVSACSVLISSTLVACGTERYRAVQQHAEAVKMRATETLEPAR